MIPALPSYDIRIGDLVMVSAKGKLGTPRGVGRVLADMHIPVARALKVVIADAVDPLYLGKRFTVRALDAHIQDYERHRQELFPLSAYGMRIAKVWRTLSGFIKLRVERDPAKEPDVNPHTGKPFAWGDPMDWHKSMPFLEMDATVGESALPFIRLPEGVVFEERAAA